MNEFTTVFDLTSKSVRAEAIYHLVVSMVLIAGGLTAMIFHGWVIKKLKIRIARGVFSISILLGIWWWFGHMDVFYYTVLDNAKNAQVVEGIVHISHYQPYHGHTSGDKITINDQPFEVDFFKVSLGYNETVARGGILREGTYVRVHYCDGDIIKIEVRK